MRWAFLLAALACGQAAAHELLSWWNRDLLPVQLRAGDWIEMASLERREGEVYADTLRCEVVAAEATRRWLHWTAARGVEEWLVEIDAARLGGGDSLLDLVLRLYRRETGGTWQSESVDELAQSAIVRGRLEDPFEAPQLTRKALPDTTIEGSSLPRERVTLHEQRSRRIALGRQAMDYQWTLHSEATLSAAVPIFGLLRSESFSEESTQRFDAEGRALGAPSPPLRNESWLHCLRFGRRAPRGLPKGLFERPGNG